MKISDLYQEVASYGQLSAEYVEKMLHKVPAAKVVDRVKFLSEAVEGKTIFDLGASGPMSEILRKKAAGYYSADLAHSNGTNHYQIDFDAIDQLPDVPLDLIIAGEVLEHLSNAGHFLDLLHAMGVPVILTVPNAFSVAGHHYLMKSIECVNKEHVAWYSYHTLKVLIERHGFRLKEWFWYNGQPIVAEGIIFIMEPEYGNDKEKSTG